MGPRRGRRRQRHGCGPTWARSRRRAGRLAPADVARIGRALARWAARLPGLRPAARSRPARPARWRGPRPGGPPVAGGRRRPRRRGAVLPLGARATSISPPRSARSVAVVGSRAATSYGERVAFDLADGLADAGGCVVSGGAYGIDAAAHRGALARGGPTLVVLAGGVDRAYPAGNARLLESVVAAGGALVSEVPPGDPADEEPVPPAEQADRRGGPGDRRRRGGVALGRDEHRAPRRPAPAPGRRGARAR